MNPKPAAILYSILALFAAGMLFWALSRHSYDYYTLLRFVVCAVSAFGAYLAFKRDSTVWGFGLAALALLFNPVATVGLRRQTWAKVDVAAGILLIISATTPLYRSLRSVKKSSGESAEGSLPN